MTALAIVGASDMLATIPERLVLSMRGPLGLVVRELPFELPPIGIDLIWHESRQHDPMLSWVRQAFDRESERAGPQKVDSVRAKRDIAGRLQ